MILTQQQKLAISTAEKNRNGLINGVKRWPERTVVYKINEDDFGLLLYINYFLLF